MKLSKSLLSGLLAAAFATAASASPTIVHVVGSTAFRAPFTKACIDYLTNNGTGAPSYCYWGSSNYLGANGAMISGTIGSTQVVFETYWTGSVAGVVDLVTANTAESFLDYNTYNSSCITTGSDLGSTASVASSLTFTGAAPDVAMSDSYYKSVAAAVGGATVTGSTGAALANSISTASIHNAGTNTTGHAGKIGAVGVIPFEWIFGNVGTSGIDITGTSNMTQQAAKQLVEAGNINLSQLTNNPADLGNFVLLVGRNEDSGTRLDSLADAQTGIPASTGPTQVLFTFTNNQKTTGAYPLPPYGVQTGGNGASVSGIQAWPSGAYLNTESGISWSALGHSGYVAGGDVANALLAADVSPATLSPNVNSNIAPTSGDYVAGTSEIGFVGYVGVADAYSTLSGNSGGNNTALLYNGVAYSPSNVENGSYTLWGYEHMYYTTATGTGAGQLLSVINGVADEIFSTDADINSSGAHAAANQAGILYSTMNFARSLTEGGYITPAQ
jgi:hypothetical protein